VLGWTAVTGTVDPHALLLFLIIFVWTPPHFWALAIHRRHEYAKVDIPMLPVTHGVQFTRLQVLLYTILLVVITVLPFATHMSGPVYLAGALLLGAGFLYHAWALMRDETGKQAMKTFGYSITYLMVLFAILLVDHYIPY
jgi:protoheme IX farnesyltransferase